MYLANPNLNQPMQANNQPQYADYKSGAHQPEGSEYPTTSDAISKDTEEDSQMNVAEEEEEKETIAITQTPATCPTSEFKLWYASVYDGYNLPFWRRLGVSYALDTANHLIKKRKNGEIDPYSFYSWEPSFVPKVPNVISVPEFAQILFGFTSSTNTLIGDVIKYDEFIAKRIYDRPFFYRGDGDMWYLGMARYSKEKHGDIVEQYAAIDCSKYRKVQFADIVWDPFSLEPDYHKAEFCILAINGLCEKRKEWVTILDETWDEMNAEMVSKSKNEILPYLLKMGPAVKQIGNLFGVEVDTEINFPPPPICFGRAMKAISSADGYEITEERKAGVAFSRKVARKIIKERSNGRLSKVHSFPAALPDFDPEASSVLSTTRIQILVSGFFSSYDTLTGKIMTYDELVSMHSYNHPFMYYENGVYYLGMLRFSEKDQADIIEQYAAIDCYEKHADEDFDKFIDMVCWYHKCRFDPKTVILLDETYDDLLTLKHPKPTPKSMYPSFKKMAATTLIFGTLFGLPLMQAIFGN